MQKFINMIKYCGINLLNIIKIIVSQSTYSLFLPKLFLCLVDKYFYKS